MSFPFPGMDPYIETPELCSDFHSDLASEMRAQLNRCIQPHYFARLTPCVTYEVVEVGQVYGVRPDVGVWQLQTLPGESQASTAIIAPAPVESLVPLEIPLRLHRVEIRATASQQLVTVVEILSPVNKRPSHEAYLAYQRKRRDIYALRCICSKSTCYGVANVHPWHDPSLPRRICRPQPSQPPSNGGGMAYPAG